MQNLGGLWLEIRHKIGTPYEALNERVMRAVKPCAENSAREWPRLQTDEPF